MKTAAVAGLLAWLAAFLLYSTWRGQFPPDQNPRGFGTLDLMPSRRNLDAAVVTTMGELGVRLNDARGKVLYLNFWAQWCEPCLKELPLLSERAEEWAEKDVLVWLINTDIGPDEKARAKEFWAGHAANLTSFFDFPTALRDRLGIGALPYHIVLDRNGRVALEHYGDITIRFQRFEELLERLSAERAPSE